jgi:tRNA dimethylallyltransferase
VYEISGRSLSSFFQAQQAAEQAYTPIKFIIAPEHRQTLHDKIAERFKKMLAQGFLDEVRALRQRGDLDVNMPSVRCVGYRQAWSYLQGEDDLSSMQEKAIAATRQLAKRQFTWLRKEQQAWHLVSGEPDVLRQTLAYYRNYAY